MGGSTDAFSLYLRLFQVEKPRDASKESTTLSFFQDQDEKSQTNPPSKSEAEGSSPSQTQTTIPPFPSDILVATISTVDLDLLEAGDEHQRELVYQAATGYGFFYLQNHHVDSTFMFDLASQVFSLPLEEKMKYDMGTTGHYYGYKRSGAMIVDDKGIRTGASSTTFPRTKCLAATSRHRPPAIQRGAELHARLPPYRYSPPRLARQEPWTSGRALGESSSSRQAEL